MHYCASQIVLALIFLLTTSKDGLIEGRSPAGSTQRVESSVNAEYGQYKGYSDDALADDTIEKESSGDHSGSLADYAVQSLYKRLAKCDGGQSVCGNGCMPQNADCCNGNSYCKEGTECTESGRCRLVVTTSTIASATSSTDAISFLLSSILDVVKTTSIQTSTETDTRSSVIVEIIRTVTAQPLDENNGSSGNGTTSTGIIAGATVGGVVAGALAMGGLWFLFRRRKRGTEHQEDLGESKPSEPTPSPFSYPEPSPKGSKPTTELDSTYVLEMECHRSTIKGKTRLAELEQPTHLVELDASQYPHR
ncbi:unnamed protein product [Clonostachys rosea]|uniref:Mid2 domain-containing protein n=1 Tax=Bionectria ochroleuca TaxID=29856 RepID=A0ABY6TUI9_BIOOC|nr:unnamed protein product [Clonostachys rosea]